MALTVVSSSTTPRNVWPNKQTCATSASIITNIICITLGISSKSVFRLNAGVRLISSSLAVHDKQYEKVLFDIAALAVIFFKYPYAPVICIGLDVISEFVNYKLHPPPRPTSNPSSTPLSMTPEFTMPPSTLDPSDLDDAYTILDISKEDRGDLRKIRDKHNTIVKDCQQRIRIPGASQPVREVFETSIADATAALATIEQALASREGE